MVSGSTERRFLENIEEIVTQSLPLENLRRFFQSKDVAETYLLNQITFCEEMIQVNFQGVTDKRENNVLSVVCLGKEPCNNNYFLTNEQCNKICMYFFLD